MDLGAFVGTTVRASPVELEAAFVGTTVWANPMGLEGALAGTTAQASPVEVEAADSLNGYECFCAPGFVGRFPATLSPAASAWMWQVGVRVLLYQPTIVKSLFTPRSCFVIPLAHANDISSPQREGIFVCSFSPALCQ